MQALVYIARGDHKKKAHIFIWRDLDDSGDPQPEWLAWLEEQERKPDALVPPNNPVVEEFDPLRTRARIVEEEWGDWERWGHEGKGRNRVILKQWFLTRDLENSIAPQMLGKIRQSVRTRLRWGILLRNTEDNCPLFWYTNVPASPWMNKYSETKDWLEALEESRLQGNVQRPDTKWVFDRAVSVDLKAILDRQLLRIGLGRLPAWLRNKREVIALDNYEDALCVFRCIAVHQGARPDRNARRTRQLAQSFLAAYPKLLSPIAVNKLCWHRIAAYTVTQAGDFVLSHTPARYDKVGRPTMTIGIYGEHAFLITDINKVTNNNTCGDCGARFTFSCSLARHAKTCYRGETKFDCPGNRIFAPESAF